MNQFSFQVHRRNNLKVNKQDYKSFKINLAIKAASRENNKVSLQLTEHTLLKLDVPGGPDSTEYKQDILFEFVYQGQEWKLVEERILRPVSPHIDTNLILPDTPPMIPTINAPSGYGARNSQERQTSERTFGALLLKASFGSSFPQSGFNHQVAATYAQQYALTYNTAYYRFNNDCTNFASQSMFQGGWQMVGLGVGFGRTNPDNWYYSCVSALGRPIASYSWGAAYNFNVFILRANRVQHATYFQDLQPGDIIFADWDTVNGPHQPDGRVDHVMIVTVKDSNGNIYVSYHTNDTKNRSINDIILHEPSANFFGDTVN